MNERAAIAVRLAELRCDIERIALAAQRDASQIGILAVTKGHAPAAICEAIAAGISDIGENYVQEAQAKFAELPQVRKHFIGHVQTNKASLIAQLFDVVQSVDRLEAGTALARSAQRCGKLLPVLIQINVSPSERFGCSPKQAAELAERLRALQTLQVDGVMAIAPNTRDPAALNQAFGLAAATFHEVGGQTLSIGMSADWPYAVRAGSTLLRIGTALFGPRPSRPASNESG